MSTNITHLMSPVVRAKPPVTVAEKLATAVGTKSAMHVTSILQSQSLLVVGATGSYRSQYLSVIKWTASLLVFLSVINALVANPVVESPSTNGCFQCFNLMNKRWRTDMPGECSGTQDDCGKCIEGYAKSKDEKCHPKDVITVEKNGIALIPDESIAVIKCEFQEKYDCSWSRRGHAIDISGRYKFQEGNGLETKICSIIIEPFIISNDYGMWECKSMADSTHVAKPSTAVILTSDRFITADENDKDAYVPNGETVIIQCHFNKLVECAWERRTHAVEIKGRYSYLSYDGGKSTTDCSIKISSFTEIDTGLWNCRSMADSSHWAIQSTNVQIMQVLMPTMTVAPQNVTAKESDNVVLNCEFDAEVNCSWQKDGILVVVDNRYKFTENPVQSSQTRRSCSLTISNARKSDAGRWDCNYAGDINSDTNTNSAWIKIQQKPSKPYIYLEPSTEQCSCSNKLVITEGSRIACTSKNGNPAPQLRWILGGSYVTPDATSNKIGNDVFNVSIFLDYSKHKKQFNIGANTLKCIVTHPTIDELSTQVDILVIGDKLKVNRRKSSSIQATGYENVSCCPDAQAYDHLQSSNSRRNYASREITCAAIVLVVLIYLQSLLSLVVKAIGSTRIQDQSFINCTTLFLLFLCMINVMEASPVNDSQTTNGCFQCFDLMNRRWRSDMQGQCSGTKDDCGKCIDGYADSSDEKCKPKSVSTVENSGMALIPDESKAVIKCEFQEECDCSWSRRGHPLDISGRYKFQEGNGLETKICSIIIEPFIISNDYGLWECKSMADSIREAKTSISVILISDRFITIDENDKAAHVPSNETVILQCHFDKTVDCAWKRRTHAVEIKGRYSYLSNDGGISTTDCSIKISLFTEIDAGLWNCESMADSSNGAIQSTQVHIMQAIMPSITVAPHNVSAKEGNNVVLNCEFDAEVNCSWQKDGIPVARDNRYKFTEKTVQSSKTRRSCSLTISSARKSDAGRWECNYAGHINSDTNTNYAWISIQQKPNHTYINLRNATGLYNCSTNLVIGEGSHIVCTSENGNPAPQLRWNLEGRDIAPNTVTTNAIDDVFNVTISLDYSLHKNQFKIGWNTLKCIATHPTIKEELSTQVDILVIEDQPKVRRSLLNFDQKTVSGRAICCQDAQSYKDMQGSNSRQHDVSREITAAAIVLVLSIYLLTQ